MADDCFFPQVRLKNGEVLGVNLERSRPRDEEAEASAVPQTESQVPEAKPLIGPAAKEAQLATRAADKDPTLRRFLRCVGCVGGLEKSAVECLASRNDRLAERFILYMLHFSGTGGDAPLVRPVPFLPERFVKQASAVLRVQVGVSSGICAHVASLVTAGRLESASP
eukprot:Skav231529  [mRNA]  locus=scaffold84:678950:683775:- [translate_table: standard]